MENVVLKLEYLFLVIIINYHHLNYDVSTNFIVLGYIRYTIHIGYLRNKCTFVYRVYDSRVHCTVAFATSFLFFFLRSIIHHVVRQ